MSTQSNLKKRWLYLAAGVFAMLFSGVLYAWSILKVPFKEDFGFAENVLSLNFTLTMCFFCLGAFFGSLICKKIGVKITLVISGLLVGAGFVSTGLLTAQSVQWLLYITYALLAGTGIGISYNIVVSTVCSWFPDRKGFCSGCLMMGFGISTLLMGNIISILFGKDGFGVSKTYILLGTVLAAVLVAAGIILRKPSAEDKLPSPKTGKSVKKEAFESRDFTTAEMLKTFTFWRAFVCMAFITAVGNSVISFARDLVISVDAAETLAVTLVGVLSVCNGIGRILTGALYDALGRRTTMISANILTIVAAGITLLAVQMHSLPVCIIGLCLTGLSYGSCPTLTSAFTSSFYGQKYFSVNYSLTNFNLIVAAFIANFSNSLLARHGSYTAPFTMLLILAAAALGLNVSIKKP
ncbi:MAG: OFA family MFS transporter [Ruminococcaceae bacterium]|nr:OFA family MFS transporter [Oscillospiraceae bacterium]